MASSTLTADVIKRITYSKYLLNRAKSHYRDGDPLASSETILTLHDASEVLMRVITDHLNLKPNRQFLGFWETLEAGGHQTPPKKGNFDRLNALRVGFKHKGNLPNPSEVADFIPMVQEFCNEVSHDYLSLNYETVSLAELVESEKARDYLNAAQIHYSDQEWGKCLMVLSDAMSELNKEASKRLANPRLSKLSLPPLHSSGDPMMGSVVDAINQLISEFGMLELGVSRLERRKFISIMPSRVESMNESVQYQWWHQPANLIKEDVYFCIQFVIDFALKVQSLPTLKGDPSWPPI